MVERPAKSELHPRNRFRTGYDFPALVEAWPALGVFVGRNRYGAESVDFANPAAVKALNQALLRSAYGIAYWDIPPGYLCPPIPGRSDYIHHLADLLAVDKQMLANHVRVLDIGVGANCVYPLIGASEYGWSFVGAELDADALAWAQKLVAANPTVAGLIECRLQPSATQCFQGVWKAGEVFTATMCNPPFHASATEAAAGSLRKLRNLSHAPGRSKRPQRESPPNLNFGGQSNELWCRGGEFAFVLGMMQQSVSYAERCDWFTTLIAKGEHLQPLVRKLKFLGPKRIEIIPMAQGQKQSRLLAWGW